MYFLFCSHKDIKVFILFMYLRDKYLNILYIHKDLSESFIRWDYYQKEEENNKRKSKINKSYIIKAYERQLR